MSNASLITAAAALLAVASAAPAPLRSQEEITPLQQRVMNTERAFAKTMADRDAGAFATYVSEEAVFYGQQILRGRSQVAGGWKGYFEGAQAPFSWEPDHVEVLPSGKLALSSGPVYDPSGKLIGTFNSVWRLEADGHWRVVFDKGCACTS